MDADGQRSADSHMIPLSLPGFPGIDIYLKDESSHPTGSLKHRLARSLILYGICNGLIGPRTVLGRVDKLDSQNVFAVIQDCFLGGGFGTRGFVGRRVAAHWRAFAG